MKAIILGGTSGIGKSVAQKLKKHCKKIIITGRKQIDTTSIESVNRFIKKNQKPDVLVLNTGGPPNLKFSDITNEIWIENFNRLFLSFANIIKNINVKNNGYIFLISSFIVRQPGTDLIMSSSLRSGFVSLFKSLSKIQKEKNISFINIAPGPIKTERLINLVKNDNMTMEDFKKTMPTNNIPEPKEIGLFVKFVVKNKIKSLNGVTIPFDSGLLENI